MKPKLSLIGRTFSRLTVISPADPVGTNKRWLCKCQCGTEKIIYQNALCAGSTTSCGCYSKEASKKRMSKGWEQIFTKDFLQEQHIVQKKSLREIAKEHGCTVTCVIKYMKANDLDANDKIDDLTGQRFEMLTVIGLSHLKHNTSYWNAKCDCGKETIVQRGSLLRCKQISCGCYNKNKEWQGCGDLSQTYWGRLHNSAKERNLSFKISIDYGWQLFEKQKGICALSGVPLIMDKHYSQNLRTYKKQTASLDRIDSNEGYIVGNVQWVHLTLNKMKSNLNEAQFREWCQLVVDYQINRDAGYKLSPPLRKHCSSLSKVD